MFSGERHAFENLNPLGRRYNFAGPGTHVIARLIRGDKPINKIDEAAMEHDIDYLQLAVREKLSGRPITAEDVRKADDKFLNKVSENSTVDIAVSAAIKATFAGKRAVDFITRDPGRWVRSRISEDELSKDVSNFIKEIDLSKYEDENQRTLVSNFIEFSKEFVKPNIQQIPEGEMSKNIKLWNEQLKNLIASISKEGEFSKRITKKRISSELSKSGQKPDKSTVDDIHNTLETIRTMKEKRVQLNEDTLDTIFEELPPGFHDTIEEFAGDILQRERTRAEASVPDFIRLINEAITSPAAVTFSSSELMERIPTLSKAQAGRLEEFFELVSRDEEIDGVSVEGFKTLMNEVGIPEFEPMLRFLGRQRYRLALDEPDETEATEEFEEALEDIEETEESEAEEALRRLPERPGPFADIPRELARTAFSEAERSLGLPAGMIGRAVRSEGAPAASGEFGVAQVGGPVVPRVRGEAAAAALPARPAVGRPPLSVTERRRALSERQRRGERLTTREMRELLAPTSAAERLAERAARKSLAEDEEFLGKKAKEVESALSKGKAFLDIFKTGDDPLQAPSKQIIQTTASIRKPDSGDFPVGSSARDLDVSGLKVKQMNPKSQPVAPMKTAKRQRWRGMTNNPLVKTTSFKSPDEDYTVSFASSSFIGDKSLSGVDSMGKGKPLMVGVKGSNPLHMGRI